MMRNMVFIYNNDKIIETSYDGITPRQNEIVEFWKEGTKDTYLVSKIKHTYYPSEHVVFVYLMKLKEGDRR